MKHGATALWIALAACGPRAAVESRSAVVEPTGCAHGVCVVGGALTSSCNECADIVCQYNTYCCEVAWDEQCVSDADTLCEGICQTCSVDSVPIVPLSEWDGTLPDPAGRQVLVLGPWTDPEEMSVSVFQELEDQVVLVVVLSGADLGQFFAVASRPYNTVMAGVAPGLPPNPVPSGPAGQPGEIIAAAAGIARDALVSSDPSCGMEGFPFQPVEGVAVGTSPGALPQQKRVSRDVLRGPLPAHSADGFLVPLAGEHDRPAIRTRPR